MLFFRKKKKVKKSAPLKVTAPAKKPKAEVKASVEEKILTAEGWRRRAAKSKR